jgi:hypothetical protein
MNDEHHQSTAAESEHQFQFSGTQQNWSARSGPVGYLDADTRSITNAVTEPAGDRIATGGRP